MSALVPPPADVARKRELTYATVAKLLADVLVNGGLRVSPLGPAWSRDVDAYVCRLPQPEVLESAGWVNLDPLLGRLGFPSDGRWAVVFEGEVIGAADLERANPPHPVAAVLGRAHRQRYFGAREEAELEVLRSQGHAVPESPRVRNRLVLRRHLADIRNCLRPREVVEIIGGDGSARSRLAGRLVEDLTRAGVPASRAFKPARTEGTTACSRLASWRALCTTRGVVVFERPIIRDDHTNPEALPEVPRGRLAQRLAGIASPPPVVRLDLGVAAVDASGDRDAAADEAPRDVALAAESETLCLEGDATAQLSLASIRHIAGYAALSGGWNRRGIVARLFWSNQLCY